MELYREVANPDGEEILIANSETVAEGAFMYKHTDGTVYETDAVANPVYGLVVGFRDKKNAPLNSAHATYTGTLTTSNPVYLTYAAASDNVTVDYIAAQVRPVRGGDVFTGECDAAIGTTTGSDKGGYFISVLTTDATKLDESSASTSQQQFKTKDNGLGENSCQHPTRKGNWVLFEVIEIQDFVTQA